MIVPSRQFRPKGLTLGVGIATFALCAVGISPAHAAQGSATALATSASKPAGSAAPRADTARRKALAQAHSTGKPVPVTSDTTPFSTLTAEPNGKLLLTDSVAPQRAKVDGTWKPLDAALAQNTDGTWSPKLSTELLAVSGGGTGPLATMTAGTYGLSLTLPASIPSLPTPTVNGDTATYRDVLPGVSLTLTSSTTGGFAEVFQIENAAAATNPALAALTFGTKTTGGVTVAADKAGNLTARTPAGTALFTAPIPEMWDSATSSAVTASATTDPHTGIHLDKRTGEPVTSSPAAPGAAAHTARLGVAASHGALTLTPDKALVTGKNTVWPLYIDPTWSSTGGNANNWTYTSSEYPTATHWDIPTSSDYLHVGYVNPNYDTDGYNSNDISYFQYNLGALSSLLSGSTIHEVDFYTDDVWSDTCTSETTDLYSTGAITTTTSANSAPAWGGLLEHQSFAYGGTGCAAAQDVDWQSKTNSNEGLMDIVQSKATAGITKSTTLTLALRADDETNPLTWRKFDQNTAKLTIQFDQPPNTPQPTDMSTSPATPCASTQADAIGLGPVKLYTYVSTKMGSQNPLEYEFELWKTNGGSSSSPLYTFGPSGSATTGNDSFASTAIPAIDFSGSGGSNWTGGSLTEFSWRVQVSDGLATGGWSQPCDFYYDPTQPGPPSFTNDAAQCSGGAPIGTAGTSLSFPVSYNTSGAKPSAFRYQLNTSAPATVPANSDGTATITITPTERVNILTVTSVSAGGNIGVPEPCQFIVGAAPNAADRDMNDDGIPDLLTPGQTQISSTNPGTTPYTYTVDTSSAIPDGLYLAPGIPDSTGKTGTGQVQSNTVDIGASGTGTGTTGSTPAAYNGQDVITGPFTGNGFQDVLAYNPATGAGSIIQGNGNALALEPQVTGEQVDILGGSLSDVNTDSPTQLVTAYAAASASASEPLDSTGNAIDKTYPDLLGLNGDATHGYYLEYYLAGQGENTFGVNSVSTDANNPNVAYGGTAQLTNKTPDGDSNWQNWVIASTQINGGTDLVLWKPTSGELCLWQNTQATNFAIDTNWADFASGEFGYGTATLTYTGSSTNLCGQELSASFETGAQLATLETADITGSGIPAVWAVTPGTAGNVSWTTFSDLSTTTTATSSSATAPQTLDTNSHAWELNDNTTGIATTAADASGGLNLTNTNPSSTGNGANWDSGNHTAFDPDLELTTADSGSLTSSASAATVINPALSWTADIWVDPTTLNTTVWSQGGSSNPLIALSTTSSGTWALSVNTTNGTSNTYNVISGGTVDLNEWTEVTATYDTDTNILSLYADGNEIAVASDANVQSVATGPFLLGAQQNANTTYSTSALSRYFNGQLADLRTWSGAIPPTSAAAIGSDYIPVNPVRIMDTRANSSGQPTDGATLGPVTANSTTVVPVEGSTVNGASIPTTGVTAVAVSITVANQSSSGYITAYPDGAPVPVTSTLNYLASGTQTNAAIVPLGADGDFDIYNSSPGTAQLIVDVTGYFTTTTTATQASTYVPLYSPVRALDTRNGTGAPQAPIASNSAISLTIAGNTTAGIPANGTNTITAVAINLTAINSSGGGYLIAYPDGNDLSTTVPAKTTSLTYASSQNIAAALIVPVGPGGKIDIYNSGGASVNVTGDISGYYTTATTGQKFHTLSSTRLLDTRRYNPAIGTLGPIAANSTITIATPAAINATNPTLDLNITVTQGTAIGDLNIYPDGQPTTASAINWAANQNIANLNVAAASNGNKIDIHNTSSGTVQVIVDVDGYFVY